MSNCDDNHQASQELDDHRSASDNNSTTTTTDDRSSPLPHLSDNDATAETHQEQQQQQRRRGRRRADDDTGSSGFSSSSQHTDVAKHKPGGPAAGRRSNSSGRAKPRKVIGNYTLVSTLGSGSMGKVKMAVHNITQDKVLIRPTEETTWIRSNVNRVLFFFFFFLR